MNTTIDPKSTASDLFKNRKRPFLIAGPCSAETEEQVLETSRRLKLTGKVDMFRAGLWKPRTRPGSFEGVGQDGLSWLQKVKQLTGLPVCTEVANSSHVELCLEHGIDVFWIGARTSANPFAVQDIADALKNVDIPIMIKNPINPDLSLWIGGVERLQKAGISNIAAIHRGFSYTGERIYRNRPQWQIAIDFMQEFPDMMILNDPSHICGRRDLLASISQKAMDLNFDGLMIECHVTPDEAWSDAMQQITPEVYGELINGLILRETTIDAQSISRLESLRKLIDLIDDDLIHALASRMKIAREIGEFKKENNYSILQKERWREIMDKFLLKGREFNLSAEFIESLIKTIHDESIHQQEKVINGK